MVLVTKQKARGQYRNKVGKHYTTKNKFFQILSKENSKIEDDSLGNWVVKVTGSNRIQEHTCYTYTDQA